MKSTPRRTAAILFSTIAIVFLAASSAFAQNPGEEFDPWARWWFGIYGGVNYTMFNGELVGIGQLSNPLSTFDKGSGIGPAAGAVVEYNSGKLLGMNLLVGYDARPIKFDELRVPAVEGESIENLTTKFSYLTIEPSLRFNLGGRNLHLLVGPGFGFNISNSSEYTFVDSAGTTIANSEDLQIDLVKSMVVDAGIGLGYDIPLTGSDAATQILLTPFAEFRMALTDYLDSDVDKFKTNMVRGGLQLKFGKRRTPPGLPSLPDDGDVAVDFTIQTPSVIAQSRRVSETFPLRNYIFFEEGSTAIPGRYAKLSAGNATNFREENLLNPAVTTGTPVNERSQRQMEVYHHALNIFGDRLRQNPDARITLVGSANGDAAKGKEMAENVKNYLTTTFGINASRITTEGQGMPPHKSGTGRSSGEDKKMIDAENYRVEISGTPESILQPVRIVTLEDQPIGNDVVFSLGSGVSTGSVEITKMGASTQRFGPYALSNGVIRIDADELLDETDREARYTAKATYTDAEGETQSAQKDFRLVRADPDEEQSADRFSILFEFDDSKTVQTYEEFLSKTVAPVIPNNATVIIHGHTDVIGVNDYNQKLADRRSEETRKVLTRELTKMGKTVTFDSYGFGEDERRSPFENTLPEQRYYNRTVIIEIVPQG